MQSTSTTCPERQRQRARGFTMVSVVFILVVLAVLGSAMAVVSTRQHLGASTELQAARAYQSARAGMEWAAYWVFRGSPVRCDSSTTVVPGGSLAGFTVTVTCTDAGTHTDGATSVRLFRLQATACNAPTSGTCPATGTPAATYVERQLSWTVTR